ncbi:MAG: hypothetical protein KAJ48_02995 [Elusimicrobiales bacterium]|nr:hypothetical protein [Elusimicrobiales bacterium]
MNHFKQEDLFKTQEQRDKEALDKMAIMRKKEKEGAEEVQADRNKTNLTLKVTQESAGWLAGIGAKAIETEVPVCQKWTADVAAFWSPTMTEVKRSKLTPFKDTRAQYAPFKKPTWHNEKFKNRPKGEYYRICKEWWNKCLEWSKTQGIDFQKALANLPYYITIIVEVKTSRADFLGDKKWKHKPQADLQILSYAKGIIKDEEIPDGWWGLEHDNGIRIKKRYWPLHDITDTMRMYLIASIAERRHNRTANAFWNAMAKRNR